MLVMACIAILVQNASVPHSTTERLSVKELIVVDDGGHKLIRMGAENGNDAKITIFSKAEKPAVDVGVDQGNQGRFIRILNDDGQMLGSLNTNSANGAATLYLGESKHFPRIILGALPSDIPPGPTGDWVLQFKHPGLIVKPISIFVRSDGYASLGVRLPDGRGWYLPPEGSR